MLALTEIRNYAEVFLASGLFADTRSIEQAMTKIIAGQELGIPPFEAMRDVTIIQGKTTLAAAAIASRIKRSGIYSYDILQFDEQAASLQFSKNGEPLQPIISFTFADAKKMGLTERPNYIKQARTMLFWRAITMGARMHCPDVFGGAIYTPDELKTNGHAEPLPEPETTTVELESPFDYILEGESKYKGKKISEVPMELLKKVALITDTKRVTNRDRIMMILAIDQAMMEQSR